MKINQIPYAHHYHHLLLPPERAWNASATAAYDYSVPRIGRPLLFPASEQTEAATFWRRHIKTMLLTGMCLLIGIISAYDTYMLVRFQDIIVEENPIGRWLMDIDNGSVALFVGCKFTGTILVLTSLVFLYIYRQSMALCIAATLCIGQIILFGYLTFY